MSDTPRTDAFEDAHTQYENEIFIGYQAEFCRQLERELAEAIAKYTSTTAVFSVKVTSK